ncbi:AAA family ATPase [Nonomuraea sp. GTA35]|uniref:AAA family ATPase n=1 Tax=Nonomuraea sp. GTA35 TaxID=1676746 RepID=UPI0035C049BA
MTTTIHHEGLRAPGSGPNDPESVTRKKMQLWDRSKFLVVLVLAYLVLTWKVMADFEGVISFPEAAQQIAIAYQWIFWLLGAEIIRQLHFFVSEHWSGYHRFWSQKVFGGFERWTHRRFDDWTRFRLARALKIVFFVTLIALVLGAVLDVSPFTALLQAPALLWQALPFLLQIVFLFFVIIIQFVGLFWFLSRGGVETYFPDDIKTRFHDVWGQDHVVERVQENIVFLERPDEIERRGGYVPSGLLLWGPPGTGKTLMAEAVAGETGKPYVFVDPGAFTNMFMGIGILKVKSLFRKLRKLALRYGGVIVFFDEADSLGKRGRLAQQGPPGQGGGFAGHSGLDGCHGMNYLSEATRQVLAFKGGRHAEEEPGLRDRFFMGGGMMNSGDPGTLQALLTELSGLKKPRGFFNRLVRRLLGMRPKPPPKYRILVMMATNRPDALDEALLRPGRIDRIYKVGYPSKAGRVRTYQGYFDKVEHELTPEQIDKLATITPYATGATIKDLVNESLITAIRDGREVITWSDVLRAKRLKQLGPPEDVEYIERERHAVAVHEACHAVVAYVTRFHLEIDIATIEKGADYLGMVASIKPEDQFTRWKSEHEADIMVSLASLAGERMFFGEDNSSGVSGDLYSATYLTAMMESYWGMGSGVTSLPALQELEIMGGKAVRKAGGGGAIGITDREPSRNQPDMTPDVLGERIEFNLVRLLEKTEELLQEHRRQVLCLAHALETHKTLNGDDVVAIIRGEPGPLLDGSIYASDELYQELEDYHRDAVRAHKEHSRIDRELPGHQEPVEAVPAAFGSAPGAVIVQTAPTVLQAPGLGSPPVLQAPGPGSAAVAQGPPPSPAGAPLPLTPPVGPPVPLAQQPPAASGPPVTFAPPAASAPAAVSGSAAVSGQVAASGLPAEQSDRPEFVPWAGPAQPPAPAEPPVSVVVGAPAPAAAPPATRRAVGRIWLVIASLLGLVVLSIIAALAVTGTLAGGNGNGSGSAASGVASPGLLLLLFVVVVAGIVGAGLAFVAIKGIRTAQAKAEHERDQAHARAQLLAAAMDPDTAMRLLGYDGNGTDRRT